ncbi:MAG: cation diffusion facilitator family transporter [Anaerovibrio sp.]|nr:cation diffusion facilitator family transporter [Anaerovibrio sp.]
MTELLIRRFIQNYQDVNSSQVRKSYGLLSGGVGICINLLLCTMKLIVGFISGSVGIVGDGINNLSDAGSSVVTMLGLKLSAKPADEEHPYGHGRIEYIAALIIAGVILLVGFELILQSVGKLMAPASIEVSPAAVLVMLASVLFKLWLGAFNRTLGRKTDSPVFNAVAKDSMSDCIATSVVVLCLAVYEFTGWNLDAVAGIVVGLFIMYSGWSAASETLQPMLGKQADPELMRQLTELAMQDKRILGIHDVIAHSYGPGNVFASVHIEVPSTMSLIKAHGIANHLESLIESKLRVQATVHVDPKVVGDANFDAVSHTLIQILADIDPQLSMHDLHIFHGKKLFFDVEAPYSFPLEEQELELWINKRLGEKQNLYEAVVKLDRI